jgi:hypothetical protein
MPSKLPPTRRARGALGPARLVVILGMLVGLVGSAQANVPGFQAGVNSFHTPTWGTNPNPIAPGKAGLVWDIVEHGGVAYIGGEFTHLEPTLKLAGAIDSGSGLPMPGFPKVENGEVKVAVSDGQGGWFVGGSFQKLNGEGRNGLAHILADGTVDTNWDAPLAGLANNGPFTVWAMTKVGPYLYLGGEFTKFTQKKDRFGNQISPAYTRNHVAKVSAASGTVDAAWDPDANGTVKSIAASPDGSRVYIAGDFTTLRAGTVPRPGLASIAVVGNGQVYDWQPAVGKASALAVSPDSSRVYVGGDNLAAVDTAGGVLWSHGGGRVQSVALSATGSTLFAGGDFSSLGGQPRGRLAAVDTASGALDTAWNPQANGAVAAMTLSEDGTKVYVGGSFSQVRGKERNNVAALDAATGSLEAWNPNANGAITALSVSGSLVYVGGQFSGLGAQPRTMLAAINMDTGSLNNWAPQLTNDSGEPPVVQAMALSADASRIFIGGNFSHVNGVPRENLVALNRVTGEVDANFKPGELLGTVRSLAVWGNTLYAGGDFQGVRISGSIQGTGRPDNPCPAGRTDCTPICPTTKPNCAPSESKSSVWSRPGLIAAFDATTGYIDQSFWRTPASTGPGLIGQGGKQCTGDCGNGAIRAIVFSADGRFLYAGGTFSDLGGQLGMISLNRSDGSFTPWQPDTNIPIFDLDVFKGDGKSLFTAAGGAGGRTARYLPHEGPETPVWQHTFDGDSVAVDSSLTTLYNGGHYDFVDGGLYKRKHASAFSVDGEIAVNFNPELDTTTGPFTVEVAPGGVIYGGEFSRVNRRPQPGFALFSGTP